MNWDQIESKWALMTRRIRADWSDDRTSAIGPSARSPARPAALAATIVDSQTSAANGSEFKTSAK